MFRAMSIKRSGKERRRIENAMKKRSIKITDNYPIRPFRILRDWGSALIVYDVSYLIFLSNSRFGFSDCVRVAVWRLVVFGRKQRDNNYWL